MGTTGGLWLASGENSVWVQMWMEAPASTGPPALVRWTPNISGPA